MSMGFPTFGFLLVFFVPLLAVLAASPAVIALAGRWRLVDHPDSRKNHLQPTPLAGGLLLLPIAVAGFTAAFWGDPRLPNLLAGMVIIFALGVWDDRHGMHFSTKFLAQVVAALFVVQGGLIVDLNQVGLLEPLGLKYSILLSTLVTLGWIVGVTNAVNLIDGMDGLAAGLCLNGLVGMTALALVGHQPRVAVASLALMGGILGFLRFNLPPARTFLGDSGSLLLGFSVATLAIHQSAKSSTFVVLVIPVLFMAIPMTDTVVAFARRILGGRNPFHADRGHIHHVLLDMDFSPLQTLGYFYTLSAVLGGLGLWLAHYRKAHVLAIALMLLVAMVAGVRALQVVNIRSAVTRLNRRMRAINRRFTARADGLNGERFRFAALLSVIAGAVLIATFAASSGPRLLAASAAFLLWVTGMMDIALAAREVPTRQPMYLHASLLFMILLAVLVFTGPIAQRPFEPVSLAVASGVLIILAGILALTGRTFLLFLHQPLEVLSLYAATALLAVVKHYSGTAYVAPLALALANTALFYTGAKTILSDLAPRPVVIAAGLLALAAGLTAVPWLGLI